MMKAGTDCWKLPLKTTEEDDKVAARKASATDICIDTEVLAGLSKLDGIFALREDKRTALLKIF